MNEGYGDKHIRVLATRNERKVGGDESREVGEVGILVGMHGWGLVRDKP